MFQYNQLKVYFRDQFVDFSQANISIANTGFLYGLGAFTGIRAHYNTKHKQLYLFRPHDHFQRLYQACKLCYFDSFTTNFTAEKFITVLLELLGCNNIKEDAYVRVTTFVDEQSIGVQFNGYKDALAMFLYPLGDYVATTGMKCTVSSWRRVDDNAMPSRAKIVGAYVNTAFSKTEALLSGFDEAIVLDQTGNVVEGSAENIFIVRDGTIITPPVTDNILEGVTRRSVITIARDQGWQVIERSIDRSELYFADEIFLTGTACRVAPVVQVDHYPISDGTIGPIVQQLQTLYSAIVKGDQPDYNNWLVPVYQ
ncbi:MAG: branched-chain amino acid transaminase [Candidatus Kerfeldbacteria bacterium]|nr:branched-chain amino acid transaminase [Candidatus Kerfeldbacteria bacterium]